MICKTLEAHISSKFNGPISCIWFVTASQPNKNSYVPIWGNPC